MDRNLYNRVRIKSADELAVERDNRLQNCGLLYHENQSTNKGYVGPPERRITGNGPRFTATPLTRVQPKPGMEIHATDGEAYTLPLSFTGNWFDVVSPKDKALIP